MVDKLYEYEGLTGRVHDIRQKLREKWDGFKEWKYEIPTDRGIAGLINHLRGPPKLERTLNDYSHVYRQKTRGELVRVSAAVMGIEFSYAAETAFVSPTLLKIGVGHQHMTLVWALSPLVGFFITPILGSVSDRCRSKYGRRRPFIVLLAIGVFIGLLLVPNGEGIGYVFGDPLPILNQTIASSGQQTLAAASQTNHTLNEPTVSSLGQSQSWGIFFTILGTVLLDFDADACQSPARAYLLDVTIAEDHARGLSTFTIMAGLGGFMGYGLGGINWDAMSLGIMLGGHLHATFTLTAIIFIICVSCTITSFKEIPLYLLEADAYENIDEGKKISREKEERSNEEKLDKIAIFADECSSYGSIGENKEDIDDKPKKISREKEERNNEEKLDKIAIFADECSSYGSIGENKEDIDDKPKEFVLKRIPVEEPGKRHAAIPMIPNTEANLSAVDKDALATDDNPDITDSHATLSEYLMSIIYMPYSMKMVCLTNLFCWMAHVCYSLYFTDFVGEAVYGGDPKAPDGSLKRELYESGVRFGCWGMAMYSLSCACYSLVIEKLIQRYKARKVYIYGLLFYSMGMMMMGLTKHPVGVILFSWTAGVMYSTLFTMPYLLIARYHASSTFAVTANGVAIQSGHLRGLGTDIAIVSSMVFLAQFTLSCCLGTIVSLSGTTTAVVFVASTLAACGAGAATQIMYLDL